MRLGALLDTRELGLALLVGADALDHEFERVFTATLRDPTRYLTGGELVLSGMRWLSGPEECDAFVDTLVRAGVVALGAGTADVDGPLPGYMVESCRRAGLPLFEVPVDVSFATVSERIILGMAADRAAGGGLARHRRLVAAVTEGGGLDDLVEAGSVELGAPCWVLSATGRVLAGSAGEPEAERRAALARQFLLGERLPLVVAGDDGPVTLLGASARTGPRLAGWFVVVGGDHDGWDPGRREVAAEFAALVGLQRSRDDEANRIGNRAAEPLLRVAIAEQSSRAEVYSRLAAAGFAADEPLWVVSVSTEGGGPGLAPVVLEELMGDLVGPRVTGSLDGELFGVAQGTGADPLAGIRATVRVIEPALGSVRLAVGLSEARDGQGLRPAIQECGHARTLAGLGSGRASVVAGDEVASHRSVLAVVPADLRRSFGTRVLGPVVDYDAAHGSDFVRTLRVFLEYNGSWTQTAAELHLHVNTLRYRIGRISELTGRDLGRFVDRVDLYLAGCLMLDWSADDG